MSLVTCVGSFLPPALTSAVIDESSIPVKGKVRRICEILGFDPLFLANEGKLTPFCAPADAARILDTMKHHRYGKDAALIGTVVKKGRGQHLLQTVIGGSRVLDLPMGELVPRICRTVDPRGKPTYLPGQGSCFTESV